MSTHDAAQSAGRHGYAVPRGHVLLPGTRGGRFGRMFGFLPQRDPGDKAIKELFGLLERLSKPRRSNPEIPAGYTYLAQFVDHDITFDPTSMLGRDNDPQALVNFRTPRYDLDSLYGSGPQDQPFLYDWDCEPRGVKLLVGHNAPDPCLTDVDDVLASVDLPRNERGRALIGDARNDENLIVSQLHLLFIHFHNKVVDCLCEDHPHLEGTSLFEEAGRIVRWHYQWIVVHDLLERLVGATTAHSVLQPGRRGEAPVIARRHYDWQDEPVIPVEFSAAAFRCGHSMVRDRYAPKAPPAPGAQQPSFAILPDRDDVGRGAVDRGDQPHKQHFGGFRRLPDVLTIEWEQFFEIDRDPQLSLRIDVRITEALFSLPPDGKKALPLLNLRRGRALGLPAGHDVARAMGHEPLSRRQLKLDDDELSPACAEALFRATPLWYYILCEALERSQGFSLGPVGGRIVAEVLVGLLEGDPQSYLRQWPAWRPHLPSEKEGEFTMPDLVRFADPRLAPRHAGAHA